MARASLRLVLLCASLLAFVLPPGTSQEAPDGSVERFKVKLLGVETSYGQEKWKTSPSFQTVGGTGETQRTLENDVGQYDGAVGYRVILRIQLTDEQGNNVPADPVENRNVNLTASLSTPKGAIPGYVQRMCTIPTGPLCDTLVFKIHFDVDGSNQANPAVPKFEPVAEGLAQVKINIFKRGTGTATIPAGEDTIAFAYQRAQADIRVDAFGARNPLIEVPDQTFRLLNDIGDGATVPFVAEQVPGTATIHAQYSFGIPGRTVRWMAFTPTPCASPSCLPTEGATRSELLVRVLATQKTDAIGNVTFSVPARDLLTYAGRTTALPGAIVVIAAHLQPEADLPADLGAQYAKGGFDLLTGAHEFVVPIGVRNARVTGFEIDTTLPDAVQSGPKQLRDRVAMANFLTVKLYDDQGVAPCANCGDLVAVVPDGDGKLAAKGTFGSDPAAGEYATKYRAGRIPVMDIYGAQVSWYRVLGLFYGSGSERDLFQGMVYADRGFEIATFSNPTRITEQGTYFVNVTSRNTNYDLSANEPAFRLTVLLRVSSENGLNQTMSIDLAEGGVANREVPISSSRVGTLALTYEATSGDTYFGPKTDSALFHDRSPKKRLADRIPGVEPVILLAALAALAVALRRREAF